MSLQTDRIFIAAIQSDSTLAAKLGAKAATATTEAVKPRLFTTAIPRAYYPNVDAFVEPVDNCPLPYVIVTFDGLQNDGFTKDDDYEGSTDKVQVSIEIAAESRDDLATLAEEVRQTVKTFMVNYTPPAPAPNGSATEQEEDLTPLIPVDWDFTASAVQYDMNKPCYWQALIYACDTNV